MEMKRRGFVLVLAMVMVMGASACKGEEIKEEDNFSAVGQEDLQNDQKGSSSKNASLVSTTSTPSSPT